MTNLINGLGGVAGFGENTLTRNDDSYTSNVSLAPAFGTAGLNFFGVQYTTISINNNGNITFGSGGLSTYTPFGMRSGGVPIIAPFFADVDTRGANSSAPLVPNTVTPTAGGTSRGSNIVYYDFNAAGHGTLTVTWDDVGYYSHATDKLNAFQLQLIGAGGGNFDAIFRYESINWTTGSASGGTNGLGGTVARAGYSTGSGESWYELAQSGIQDQMLALESTAGNTGVAGYYKFSVYSGTAAANTLNGTAHDDVLSGGGGNDTLNGLAGNDSLDGNAGNDRMVGGLGDDRYSVNSALDVVVEALNQGIDTVQSTISYTLGANVENLLLNGTAAINGTGNALDNLLVGNSGNNVLNGLTGSDTVSYETYSSGLTIDLSLTTAQWLNGQDTLLSIENCIGTNYSDTLRGSSVANVLDGNLGADTMSGGLGNDTYIVNIAPNAATSVAGDVVTELAGRGTDTVRSSVSWTLGANLENLTLTGTEAINGIGNTLNNVLTGNAGANALNGGIGNDVLIGGVGKDMLTGGAGADYFDFNAINETEDISTAWDVITDFDAGEHDRIDLSTIDANTAVAGNQAFVFVGTAAFGLTNATGQLRFDATAHVLYGSTDVDSSAEFAIALTGVNALVSTNFIL